MKQMRSRFRLITLLLVCAFLLTLVLCTGKVLKTAGISLTSLPSVQDFGLSASPQPSVSPDAFPGLNEAPALPEPTPAGNDSPGTDNTPEQEYNVTGL